MTFLFVVLILAVSFSCMVYELVLAQLATILLGNALLSYSVTIGLYLAGLGAGAFLLPSRTAENLSRRLFRTELTLLFLGGLSPVFGTFIEYGLRSAFDATSMIFRLALQASIYLFILSIGVLAGMELPILLQTGEDRLKLRSGAVLAWDYLGTLLSVAMFAYVLLPAVGVVGTASIAGLVTWCGALLTVLIFRRQLGNSNNILMLALSFMVMAGAALFHAQISEFISSSLYVTVTAR